MLNKRILWNGQRNNHTLCFIASMNINLDELYRSNLFRIMKERGLKQVDIAAKIKTTPQYINAILSGERGLGPDIMARLCRVLNIEPWEFTWTDKAPMKTIQEQQDLALWQKVHAAGPLVVEDVTKYAVYKIDDAKKNAASGSEGKTSGVPRRGNKRAV